MNYPLINRCAVIVVPKLPFWEWVKKTGDVHDDQLHEVKKDVNMYLVPDYETEPDMFGAIEKYIAKNFEGIFISELEAWYTDPGSFPEISYNNFKEWFELTPYTMIFDTVNKGLKKE